MPNRVKLNKPHRVRLGRTTVGIPRRTDSVKALLERTSHASLARVSEQADRQCVWRKRLEASLPALAMARISGVVERDATLVIFTESAAWAARLRYSLAEIEPQLRRAHPEIRRVAVRVMPKL